MLRLRIPSALKVTLTSIILIANSWAATEHVLWNFVGNPEGETPLSSLIADSAENLYGTTQYGGLHNEGTVFELTPQPNGGWSETVLYSFPGGESGSYPTAGLVLDAAGNLYGTTSFGGSTEGNCKANGGCGTVFELSPAGDGTWQYKLLHAFQYSDGDYPTTPLILDTAGNLYGTTFSGGACCGAVFEVSRDAKGAWSENVLYSFPCENGCLQGGNPSSKLIFDGAGNLYGTTEGGYYGQGAVFELSPNSNGQWTETTLYSFCSDHPSCPDGAFPRGGLIFDQAGSLYGTALEGGTGADGGYGVVFKLTPSSGGTWSESVLFMFPGGNGGLGPSGGVVFDAQGNLYGTTVLGGNGPLCEKQDGYGCGIVFELSPSARGWRETVVHSFKAGSDGGGPGPGVVIDSTGSLYGTAGSSGQPPSFAGGGVAYKLTPSSGGWQETVYNFWTRDGESPSGGLITDGKRNLFGTAGGGLYGDGTIFELSPVSGGGLRNTILYNFKGGTDGNGPGPLVFDKVGNLYGVTFEGGRTDNDAGTVFELSPNADGKWTESILHVFQGPDGYYPVGTLAIDASGNLYGVTWEGGSGCCGTVFELSPSPGGVWTETILHSFTGANGDGGNPLAGVIMDSAGNLYGTTAAGSSGDGTVFELSPGSGGVWTESLLYVFTGGSDGGYPIAPPTLDSAGNVYGTTLSGGSTSCFQGCGVVYELTPAGNGRWEETVIDAFDTSLASPESPVVFDGHGNLFGTSSQGALNLCQPLCGAVFELEPAGGGHWKETTLLRFTGGRVGSNPEGPLLLDADGNLYGAASNGGPANEGLVFELTR